MENYLVLVLLGFVVLFMAARSVYVMFAVARMVAYGCRLHRDPEMPSFLIMVLRFWVWNPLVLTNDFEYLEHYKNKTGPYEHLDPEYPEKQRARFERRRIEREKREAQLAEEAATLGISVEELRISKRKHRAKVMRL